MQVKLDILHSSLVHGRIEDDHQVLPYSDGRYGVSCCQSVTVVRVRSLDAVSTTVVEHSNVKTVWGGQASVADKVLHRSCVSRLEPEADCSCRVTKRSSCKCGDVGAVNSVEMESPVRVVEPVGAMGDSSMEDSVVPGVDSVECCIAVETGKFVEVDQAGVCGSYLPRT